MDILTPYFRVYQHLVYISAFYAIRSRVVRQEDRMYIRCEVRGLSYIISTPIHADVNTSERDGASCEQLTGTAV